jgi:hypothetical protein
MTESSTQICSWCSSPLSPGMSACPKCGAKLEGWESASLPDFNPSVLAGSDRTAIEPPGEAVRFEMRKMELEAEIENAGGAVMSATGDEAEPARPPSEEALAALSAGILDPVGPSGETDLRERAAVWTEEDPA